MKIKTRELSGIALDLAVAKCEGIEPYNDEVLECMEGYSPSSDWSQGGPIIEREWIIIEPTDSGWAACQVIPDVKGGKNYKFYKGATPLIAAMRCYVASKMGEEVDVPDELFEEVK